MAALLRTSFVRLATQRPVASTVQFRSFGDKFQEKERAEEKNFFNKEDEKALRKLLSKMKEQADKVDEAGAVGDRAAERHELLSVLGHNKLPEDIIDALITWKHQS